MITVLIWKKACIVLFIKRLDIMLSEFCPDICPWADITVALRCLRMGKIDVITYNYVIIYHSTFFCWQYLYIIDNLDMLSLISQSDIVIINELTMILKMIGLPVMSILLKVVLNTIATTTTIQYGNFFF
jgi:hypothetical protein